MEYKVLIVEDELIIANSIERIITRNQKISCVGIAVDYPEAIDFINNRNVDLVLLDIRLAGEKTGLDVADFINSNSKIPFIFLTSFTSREYLEKLKSRNPAGYISKPVNSVNLLTTVEITLNNYYSNPKDVVIQAGKTVYKLNVQEVIYIKADHVYSQVVMVNEKHLIRMPLSKLVTMFPVGTIHQINRSVAVNKKYVTRHTNYEVMIGKLKFHVSKKYCSNISQCV